MNSYWKLLNFELCECIAFLELLHLLKDSLNLYFVTVLLKRYIFFPKAKEVRVENDGLWGVGLERMKGWKG